MSVSKSVGAITQLTASGDSNEIDVSTVNRCFFYCQHTNASTGTITAGATVTLHVKGAGGARYYEEDTITLSKTNSDVQEYSFDVADGVGKVKLAYVAPTGATGTLDAEVFKVTY